MTPDNDQGYALIETPDLKIDREKIPYRDVPTAPDCSDPMCNGAGKPYQYHGRIWYCCSVCQKEYTRDQIVSVLQKWKYPKMIKYLDFHVMGESDAGLRPVHDQILFGSGLECHDSERLEEIRKIMGLAISEICAGMPTQIYFDFETDPHYRGEKRVSP